MKYVNILLISVATILCCSAFTMKKEKPVYVFGMAASFNDSIIYYTDIQLMDGVILDKEGFLPQRNEYAYQLKNYIEYNLNKPNYTCMIYFSDNKAKLEKETVKVKGKYKKNSGMKLEAIEAPAFKFVKP